MSLLRSSLGAWKSARPSARSSTTCTGTSQPTANPLSPLPPPPTIHRLPARPRLAFHNSRALPHSTFTFTFTFTFSFTFTFTFTSTSTSASTSPSPHLHHPNSRPSVAHPHQTSASPIYALYLGNLISATPTSDFTLFLPLLPSSIPRLSRIGASAGTSSDSFPVKR
ncbi:uncharacterized protein RSE6_08462 [Rhynchosporium secalis]|uniref:Uncharacterized protein n=1 Tax=Rhynchosporium secalis TaxID=38038 RepID=A0A1E1MFG6_RHYSE|nr:uncharacterized protein RSE6_08462 [Rhynchosporium secalis]